LSTALGAGPIIDPELMQGVEMYRTDGYMKGLDGPIGEAFAAILWILHGRKGVLTEPFEVVTGALVLAYVPEPREEVGSLPGYTVLGELHYGVNLISTLVLENMAGILMSMYTEWSKTEKARFIPATATNEGSQGILEVLGD